MKYLHDPEIGQDHFNTIQKDSTRQKTNIAKLAISKLVTLVTKTNSNNKKKPRLGSKKASQQSRKRCLQNLE